MHFFSYVQGEKCSECKPLYVGNPINGGVCRPCFDVCNRHTSICIGEEDQLPRQGQPWELNDWSPDTWGQPSQTVSRKKAVEKVGGIELGNDA